MKRYTFTFVTEIGIKYVVTVDSSDPREAWTMRNHMFWIYNCTDGAAQRPGLVDILDNNKFRGYFKTQVTPYDDSSISDVTFDVIGRNSSIMERVSYSRHYIRKEVQSLDSYYQPYLNDRFIVSEESSDSDVTITLAPDDYQVVSPIPCRATLAILFDKHGEFEVVIRSPGYDQTQTVYYLWESLFAQLIEQKIPASVLSLNNQNQSDSVHVNSKMLRIDNPENKKKLLDMTLDTFFQFLQVGKISQRELLNTIQPYEKKWGNPQNGPANGVGIFKKTDKSEYIIPVYSCPVFS